MPILAACQPGLSTPSGSDPSSTEQPVEQTTTDLEWPSDDMGHLPVPVGQIEAVTYDADSKSVTVLLSGMTRDQADAYLLIIMDNGFALSEKTDDGQQLMAHAGSESGQISFMYMAESGECLLTYFIMTDPETQPGTQTPSWPQSWHDIPAPDAKINEVYLFDEWDTIVYFSQMEPSAAAGYMDQLRTIFSLDIAEQIDERSGFFTGSDVQGRYLEFFWSDDQTASLELIVPPESVEPTDG